MRTRGITIFLFISLALSVIPAIQNNYTEPIFATSKTVDSELSTEQKRLINQTALRVVNANPGFVGNATTTITSPAAATPEMITALAQVIERIVVQTSNPDQIITHLAIETAANPTGPLSQALLLFAKQLAVGDTIGVSQLTSLIAQLTESPTVNTTTQRDITGNISQLIMQQAFQSALGANQLLNQIANKLAANSSKLSVNNVTIGADAIAQTIQQIIIQVSLQQQGAVAGALSFQPLLFIANQVNQNPMGPLSKTIVQLAQLQFTGGVGASQSIAQSISELVKQILSSAAANITESTGNVPTTEPTSEDQSDDTRTKIIIRDRFDEREPPTFQPPPPPPLDEEAPVFGENFTEGQPPPPPALLEDNLTELQPPITNATSPTNQTGTAQLRVITNVINDNNGNKIVTEFTVAVRNSTFFSGIRPQEPPPDGRTFSLSPGTYYVGTSVSGESGAFGSFPAEYSRTFDGDCDSAGVVTLTQGEPKECIINYDDGAGELRIISEVLNDNGANKTAPDLLVVLTRFHENGLSLASERKPGAPAPNGITFPVAPGTYRVFPLPHEERQYSTTFEGDCDLYGVVMLTESQSKECILKFDDGAGRLRISTGVINDDDGNRTRFIIHIANSTGSDVASEELTFSRADQRRTMEFLLPPGTYTFKHEPVSGYTTTFDDCDSSGQVIISTGLPGLFCHVTLNDIPTDAGGAANETDGLPSPPPMPITGNQTNATLFVNTRVINNHGVTVITPHELGATVDIFGNDGTLIGGTVVAQFSPSHETDNIFSVTPGSYTINFSPGPSIANFLGNYSFVSSCPGAQVLSAGDTKTCIVSFRDIAQPTNGSQPVSTGTLSIKTHVINNNTNSTLEASDVFMLLLMPELQQLFKGSEEGKTFTLPANTQYFVLVPEGESAHTISRSGDCGGLGEHMILAGENKSCTITLDDREGGAQIFSAGNATLQNLTSFLAATSEKKETICDDGIDNDNDVKVDAADEDCLSITSTPTTPDENTTTTTPPSAESEQAPTQTQEQPVEQNNPPTADAGEDSSVESGKVVKLNGDNSKDPDANQQLSYLWIQVSPGSPSVSLDGAKNEIASFKAPQVEKDTKFNFELTVKDGKGGEDTDSVTVEVLGIADEKEQKVEQQAKTSKQEQDQQEAESSKTSNIPPGSPSDIPEGKITK